MKKKRTWKLERSNVAEYLRAGASQLPTGHTRLAWSFQAHVRVVMRAAGHTIGFGQEGMNPDAWLPEFRLIHRRDHGSRDIRSQQRRGLVRRRLELMNNEVDLHRRPGCKNPPIAVVSFAARARLTRRGGVPAVEVRFNRCSFNLFVL